MAAIWGQVAFVFALALIASVIAHRYRLSTALVEIIVGMVAGSILATLGEYSVFGVQEPWVKAFAGIGAIFLTFLAGAELDPDVFRMKWKEAAAIGVASFLLPAIGCWATAHYLLSWDSSAALLAGIALAATSVAVVYTVMMEYGFNQVEYGKDDSGGLFHYRPWNRYYARPRLRALYVEDAPLRGRPRRGLCWPTKNHSAGLRDFWRQAF